MRKLLLVGAPLALYALSVLLRAVLRRPPSRHALNVELALLLSLYFLATAGLGVFWVANQQLPPFDLHYLFGYATFALVVAHLALNARIVLAHLRRPSAAGAGGAPQLAWGRAAAFGLVAVGAFYLGIRAGTTELPPAAGGRDPHAEVVAQYHAMSTHTREGVLLRAPSVAWELPVAARIDRSGRARLGLPPPTSSEPARSIADALAATPVARASSFARGDLSTLLWATAGVTERRGGVALRASASSGALFPTELYVLAFDVEGVSPGTYAYDAETHALFDLERAPAAREAFGLAPAAPPALALVVTSVFRRTGQKYRDRAYRYAVADAGHAIGNALVAAGELGLSARLAPRFDEGAVSRQIDVDDVAEGVLAVVSLEEAPSREGARAGDRPAGPDLGPGAAFAPAPMADPQSLALGATSWVHAATSLSLLDPPSPVGEALALGPPVDRPAQLFSLIAARRSARTFASAPLEVDDLSAILRHAAGPPPMLSGALRVHVVVDRVAGLSQGSHRYDPRAHTLTLGRAGARVDALGRAGLDQDVVAGAAAVVVLTADRRHLAAEGARGYRHAFLEAGVLGSRLYLAASAAGLGGCAVGAFYDAEAASEIGVELTDEWPLQLFALGTPTD